MFNKKQTVPLCLSLATNHVVNFGRLGDKYNIKNTTPSNNADRQLTLELLTACWEMSSLEWEMAFITRTSEHKHMFDLQSLKSKDC